MKRPASQVYDLLTASVVYFRAESVKLAEQMLDDTDFRLGQRCPKGPMSVKAADQNYKSQHGRVNPEAKKKGTDANRDRQKAIKKMEEMNRCV
jgi:HIV Tat-specific factor 1